MNFTPTLAAGQQSLSPAESDVDSSTESRAIWMPWIGGNRPNTAIEEATFLRRLGDLADGVRLDHRRSDTTAMLNALRCGLSADELLQRAPGLVPARLFDAYIVLDRLRHRSETAWTAIAETGTVDAVVMHGPEAAKLLPSLVSHLYGVVEAMPHTVSRVIAKMAHDVGSTADFIRSIERALHDSAGNQARCASLSRLLYDPQGSGATSSPDHLARRVGTLVPTVVAALLGERVEFDSPPERFGSR